MCKCFSKIQNTSGLGFTYLTWLLRESTVPISCSLCRSGQRCLILQATTKQKNEDNEDKTEQQLRH